MEKYVVESWFRMEKVFDHEHEAQRYADEKVANPMYKDVVFHTLRTGISRELEKKED